MKELKRKYILTIIDKLDRAYRGVAVKKTSVVFKKSFFHKSDFRENDETSLFLYYEACPGKDKGHPCIEGDITHDGKKCMKFSYDINAYVENFSGNWLWHLLYDIINEFRKKTGISPVISAEELLDDLWDDDAVI